MEKLIVYCDGGSRGNPGPAASAFVVTVDDKVIFRGSKFLGKTTNNIAEYMAVIMALEWLSQNAKGKDVTIVLDSELVTRQLSGQYKIKSSKLKPLAARAAELKREIPSKIFYTWSPRSGNKKADAMVNKTLDNNK